MYKTDYDIKELIQQWEICKSRFKFVWKLIDAQLGRKSKTNSFSCKHFREVTILRYSE